jgi:energy-coupling factor transporter ATP-binding protein EcfA2
MRLFALMRELRAQGVGLVYISHRLEEVADLADRVTVLRDGALVATRPMAETSLSEVIRLMVGRELRPVGPRRALPLGEVALEAEAVGCRVEGIRGVSFQVRSGEVLGLAGLAGSGRTQLARVLFGLTPADQGVIRLQGTAWRAEGLLQSRRGPGQAASHRSLWFFMAERAPRGTASHSARERDGPAFDPMFSVTQRKTTYRRFDPHPRSGRGTAATAKGESNTPGRTGPGGEVPAASVRLRHQRNPPTSETGAGEASRLSTH